MQVRINSNFPPQAPRSPPDSTVVSVSLELAVVVIVVDDCVVDNVFDDCVVDNVVEGGFIVEFLVIFR